MATYDPVGNILSITDPENNTTSYTYDELHRLIEETNELNKTRTYTYDPAGNLLKATDRNNRGSKFIYDELNRVTDEQWLDAAGNPIRTITYTYDAASQLKNVSDPDSTYNYDYDDASRLTSVDNAGTPEVPNVFLKYTYDEVNNKKSVTDRINGLLKGSKSFTYDDLNRVTLITQSGNGVAQKRVDMTYDAAGQMKDITRYSNLAGTQLVAVSDYNHYDLAGRLTQLSHKKGATTFANYQLTYDDANRITQFTSFDGSSDYSYDDRSQLKGTNHSYQSDEAYTYDDNGNRTNEGYQTETNNQLRSDGTYTYEYDNEGNRTKRTVIATGEVTEYVWDYRNRLIQVVTKDSSGNVIKTVEYTYDVLNRRIAKEVDLDGAGTATAGVERFVYDGEHIALSFDGNGNQTHRYLHGPSIDQILADENASSQVLWALSDNLGTVRDLIDSTGALLNHITYDSFGQVTGESNSSVNFRFGYTGRELDEETGLYYYRARYYDGVVGRFVSEDPIGFAAGDANLYRYVGNSPVNAIDPSGLIPFWVKDFLELLRGVPRGPIPPILIPDGILNAPPLPNGLPMPDREIQHLFPQEKKPKIPAPTPGTIPVADKPQPDPNRLDPRLKCKCPDPPPEFYEDGSQFPNHVRMVAAAQRLRPGEWDILTYRRDRSVRKKNRDAAQKYWIDRYGEASSFGSYDWDEYPYASTYEGGAGAYAELVPAQENQRAGQVLGAFLNTQFYSKRLDGCKFRVTAINYRFNENDPNDIPDFVDRVNPLFERLYPQIGRIQWILTT